MGWLGHAITHPLHTLTHPGEFLGNMVGNSATKLAAGFALGGIPGATAAASFLGDNSANKKNIAMAREQMAFQERMSSTEMQRRTADLAAAGLNPMLAGASQQGASSGSGARAEVESPVRGAINSALAVKMQNQQLENMTLQNRLLSEQVGNVSADTTLKYASANQAYYSWQNLARQADKTWYEIQDTMQRYNITIEQVKQAKLTTQQMEAMNPLLRRAQEISNNLDALGIPEAEAGANWFKGVGGTNAERMLDMLKIWKGTADTPKLPRRGPR